MQCVVDVGPLPRGRYRIGAPYDSSKTGPYTLPLIPDLSNDMCGRADFRIHGAAFVNPEDSSDGCIIQVHPVRVTIWQSNDHDLEVV